MKIGRRERSPLRIAIVCFSKSWGGLEIMIAKIASALASKGHFVLLISPAGSPLEAESVNRRLLHYALTPRFNYADIKVSRELAGLYKRHEIQVSIATLSRDISSLVMAKWFFPRTKLVYFQQMQFGHSKRDLFHRITYRTLDAWITLTQRMKQDVAKNTIVPPERITVISFGVDTTEFDPKRYRKSQSRRKFRLSQGKLLVGLIGRLDRQKGHEELLRAAPTILKAIPTSRIVIVGEETKGEPGYLEDLKRLVMDLHLRDKVRFLPFTNDIPLLLSALDVVAVPSHSETFGYIALEAMAMGIPVVGTNAGGLPEIVVDGKTGFLVPPKNPNALAEKLIELLKRTSARRSFGISGQKRILEKFDFEKNVRDFVGGLGGVIRDEE